MGMSGLKRRNLLAGAAVVGLVMAFSGAANAITIADFDKLPQDKRIAVERNLIVSLTRKLGTASDNPAVFSCMEGLYTGNTPVGGVVLANQLQLLRDKGESSKVHYEQVYAAVYNHLLNNVCLKEHPLKIADKSRKSAPKQ